jgi:molybdopterin/thiamine biosynthesis adenylyltransferase
MTAGDIYTLGNRHLRPSPELADLGTILVPKRVRITADHQYASSTAGQHTLWMLANLLARQFGIIGALELRVPEVPLCPGVAFFGSAPTLSTTLTHTIALIAGGTVSVASTDPAAPDAEVIVGPVPPDDTHSHFRVAILGSGWRMFVGRPRNTPTELPRSALPFGPYLAACYAAGEVFKHLRGLKPGKGQYANNLLISLWDCLIADTWAQLSIGDESCAVTLPSAYLVGVGAVGQAVVAAMAATPALQTHLTLVEHEVVDEPNLNRYVLASQSSIGLPKADVAAAALARPGLTSHTYRCPWPAAAGDFRERERQRGDLRREEERYRYGIILSCVDKNPARHAIQQFYPRLILGGSTLDLHASVVLYDMKSDYECLKCNNPLPEKQKSLEDLEQELRDLAPEERARVVTNNGLDLAAIEAHLAQPRCGSLGEQEIQKFGAPTPDWSVGFVSVAAGVTLAAQHVKMSFGAGQAFPLERGNSVDLYFLHPSVRLTAHRRSPICDCATGGRDQFRRSWPDGEG